MRLRLLALGLALGLVLASCGGDPTSSDEYRALEAQLADLETQLIGAQAALAVAESERDALTSELETTVSSLEQQIAELEVDLDQAYDDIDALELTYDEEIRADLQEAFDAEVARACERAKQQYDMPISVIVVYQASWDYIASRDELIEAVTDCAAEERAKTEEEREAERLAACETVDPDELEKNPNALAGECLLMYAHIVQYDAATGPCYFHADISSFRSTAWYHYDVRCAFGYSDDIDLAPWETNCPDLDGIDSGDYIKVWATVLGPLTYDTAMGGTYTVPALKIEKVELVAKD